MQRIGTELYRLDQGGFAAPHLVMNSVPTLIDAGSPGRGPAVERELATAGIRIERIILTHGDPDHVGGSDHLRRVTGDEVWAHGSERQLIDRSGWPALPPMRRAMLRLFFRSAPPPTIDRWIDDEVTIDGIAVHRTPGHTPGHIVLGWEGWLLAGDAFVSGERFRESPWPFRGDRAAERRSIEGLLRLEPRAASSGHGRPVEGAVRRLQALVDTWR